MNTVISSGKIVDVSTTDVLLEEANSVLESANKLFSQHRVDADASSCYRSLGQCILELDGNLFKVRQLLSSANSQRARESVSPHENSLPVENSFTRRSPGFHALSVGRSVGGFS